VTGRRALVIVELSIALVLLTGAGLLLKSFVGLLSTNLGFSDQNVLTFRIDLPRNSAVSSSPAFFEALLDRVRALPGAESVSLTNAVPLTSSYDHTTMSVQSGPASGSTIFVGAHVASPTLLESLKIPLIRGRWFTNQDRGQSQTVAVINETMARKYWQGDSPLGDKISLSIGQGSAGVTAEIVGIVGDVRYDQIDGTMGADVYLSYLQSDYRGYFLVIRTAQPPLSLVPAVRHEVANLDPNLPIYDVRTMHKRVSDATSVTRFSAFLLGALAVIAVSLSVIGIYGVMSYAVSQRTREIGVRMALGATRTDVLGMIVRDGLLLTVVGIAIGLAVSFSLAHVLASMLYGVRETDATTFAGMSVILGASALLASYVPARRATRVNPLLVLKHE